MDILYTPLAKVASNDDIRKLAAPILGISIVTLLFYAFAQIDPSNEELASVLTNVVFLYPLLYSGSSPGLFAIQMASAVVAAASFNYHEYGIIGTAPPGSRTYPRHGDLFASLFVATTACVVALDSLANRFLSGAKQVWTRPGVLRSIAILVVIVVPFAIDGSTTPSTQEKPELLEPWAASAFALAVVASVAAAAESVLNGLFIGTGILLPLVAAALPASGLITEPSYDEERAVHAYWHAASAITLAFVAGAAGGVDPLIYIEKDIGTAGVVIGYIASGLTLLVALIADPTLAYTWFVPTVLTVGLVAGLFFDVISRRL